MLRKGSTRSSAGKQTNTRLDNAQRKTVSATIDQKPLAGPHLAAAQTTNARLKDIVKASFQNMGED